MITLNHYLVLSSLLFTIGFVGVVVNRKNIFVALMSVELMLLAASLNFIAFSHFLSCLSGHIFTFFILTVAAAEASIGLALVTVYFRHRGTVDVDDAHMMKE